jgi:hypothetical protein
MRKRRSISQATNPENPGVHPTSLGTCDKCGCVYLDGLQVWVKSESPFTVCDPRYQASPHKASQNYGTWIRAIFKPLSGGDTAL